MSWARSIMPIGGVLAVPSASSESLAKTVAISKNGRDGDGVQRGVRLPAIYIEVLSRRRYARQTAGKAGERGFRQDRDGGRARFCKGLQALDAVLGKGDAAGRAARR